ncbi:TonB-linked SusC/RagA family outer membrane protein [Flavobacterium nitrogenifigens]|uniref:TonB-linked SusC/RagA family outer membrane protein n=2 Tax=Flavobacterium TaxID=237 RepID=A0A7W7J328_9FLAO|nr:MULTISPECIES: TonB-dependent receptor [Flavobacterium]MBB4804690.1 TonB-linked SusC/RagA family outer membrane protein [Flavobacterium nitrogenifigens]MBB6389649.1 TonB-linked SusC/RagA family outer membrane protein [Flavobacterium notoginsengisoli]
MTNFLITKSRSKYFKNLGFLILMLVFSAAVNAQITVSGTVSDASGPIPGVNIIVKGTKTSTVSNFDGTYTLTAIPANSTLVFSFIGYKPYEIAVNNKTKIDALLEENLNDLKEVVVIGYGTAKRADLTGAISSISSSAVTQSVATTIDQVLQGRAAGVQIQQNSGTPGGSSSVRIRGISSITGSNEPIYVIDGVIIDGNSGSLNINPLAGINPNDIASIDILKDASATAIYGSRAANGVIIVTTKTGKKGDLTLNFDSYVGWQQMPKQLQVLNLSEYGTLKNTRADLGIVQRDPYFIRPELLGEGTNWQDELFQVGLIQSYNLSASGGSDNTTYALGMSYFDQEGTVIGSSFDRLTLRGVIDSQVKKWLKVGVNMNLSKTNQVTTVNDDGVILTALKQTPSVAARNADGSFDGPDTTEFVQTNPLGIAMLKDNYGKDYGFRGNAYAEISFTKDLKLRTQYSLDLGFGNRYTFNPSYTFGALSNEVREGSRTKSNSENWIWTNTLTYNKVFGKHNVNAMFTQELQERNWENLYGYRSGYLTNGATDLNAGDPTTARNSNASSTNSLSSYLGRLVYTYNDRYILTGTIRRDGSSQFAEGNKWDWFPSASLAWKISNEGFLKDNAVINNLKLRAGWGITGNSSVPNNAYTSVYGTSATNWGSGQIATNTANPDLRWEKSNQTNIGLDFGFFNNRIEITTDVYYKKTDDLLLRLSLPAYVGTTGQGSTAPPYANIGSLENKGFEFSINTINMEHKDFLWKTNFNITMNRFKVLKLNSESGVYDQTLQQGSDVTVVTRSAVGQTLGQFYGYKVIGRFEKATDFYYKDATGTVKPTALPEGMAIGENGVWIGDYMFEDVNKDGVINEKDAGYIGDPNPDFTFGFTNNFSFKGFDVAIMFTGSYGNDVLNYQRRWLENPRENTNLLKSALGYAQLELIDPNGPNDYRNVQIVGGDPYMPRIGASSASSASNYRLSNRFVEDGSFVRLKNISIGYNLPKDLYSKYGISNIKVYSNMQNVLTFTKYKGYDPEVGAINQNQLLNGIDNGRYPSPMVTTLGLTVNF